MNQNLTAAQIVMIHETTETTPGTTAGSSGVGSGMNAEYARYYGPGAEPFDGCPMCLFELEDIGPWHGPELPPAPPLEHWAMTPREWAGDGPLGPLGLNNHR